MVHSIISSNKAAETSSVLTRLDEGIVLLNVHEASDKSNFIWNNLTSEYIQFHFSLKGKSKLHFNSKSYTREFSKDESLLIYNPSNNLPLDIEIPKGGSVISLFVKIDLFKSFFSDVASNIPFLKNENLKHYEQSKVSPETTLVLNQINKSKFQDHLQNLYLKGKAYELLSVFLNQIDQQKETCPFQMDDEYLAKIKLAKDILEGRLIDTPTLTELAEEIGLNIKKLKQGFKHVYGTTAFNFMQDYRMEFSRKLLVSGNYNINEVGHRVGYSTASHFISSFKKKYGITPKKFLQSSISLMN